MGWVIWFLLLIAQNASFTLVSRARNSKSLGYHAWAAVLSNGIWFISQLFLFDFMYKVFKSGVWMDILPVAMVYIAGTMAGSLGMHWLALHKIEKGKNI